MKLFGKGRKIEVKESVVNEVQPIMASEVREREVVGWRGEKCPYCGNYGTHSVYKEVNAKGVLIKYIECAICEEKCPLVGDL